ncbi:hypothetical protein BTVI_78889 [Pitangus sulphuratus]|nr:hypothetical protein BTVI_78889 [Pitangus sulphuratus]
MPEHPFHEEILPDAQPDPPLEQFEASSSRPVILQMTLQEAGRGAIEADSKQAVLNETVEMAALALFKHPP